MSDKNTFYESFWEDASYQTEYAFDSAVRDRMPGIQRVWGALKPPDRVLDFGSGNGVLSYWMHCNGFGNDIVGVDVSNTGIANARTAFARPGLRYEHVDVLQAMNAAASFDVVVSSHVLEHIPEPEKELAKLLPLSEWFVLEVPLEQCLWPELSCALRGKPRTDNPLGHINFWTKKSFSHFLHSSGLMIVRDFQYASAPFSPYNSFGKRMVERALLSTLGLSIYSRLLATHYVVLARRRH
ncbi:hypothetical protein METP2_03040 [Methanosarcinales archaeon]|nr:hypothetical protein METP2_03040 [Methanosarcinales archaeon]